MDPRCYMLGSVMKNEREKKQTVHKSQDLKDRVLDQILR